MSKKKSKNTTEGQEKKEKIEKKIDTLILAAGYAMRLYPLTKNFPKPLLEISGKPVITHIIEKIQNIKEIKNVYIVTNKKFYQHFIEWKSSLKTNLNVKIVNDNTETEQTKLGAIGDIYFTINKESLQGPLLIVAGDQLFDFNPLDMYSYFKKVNKDVISVSVKDIESIKRGSCVLMNNNNVITFFEEKPLTPKSNLISNCLYLYTKETVQKFKEYIQQGNNPDQPGRFLQWLYLQKEVLGFLNKGRIIDIGTHEALEKARKEFTSS